MTSRAKTGGFSEDLAKTPGPGRYQTVDPSTYKRKSPAYSMLQRNFMPGGNVHIVLLSFTMTFLVKMLCVLGSVVPQDGLVLKR